MRFIVRVDENWVRTITCEGDASFEVDPLSIAGLDHPEGRFPRPPFELHAPETLHDALGSCDDAAPIAGLWSAIHAREASGGDIAMFGHYLFDTLLGHDDWAAIEQCAETGGAAHVELALTLPTDDPHLHRLNWELMRSDGQFIVEGSDTLTVAITRRIECATPEPAQLDVPPRVLFVVGTTLDDPDLRVGSELLKLLRISRRQRALSHRVLPNAKPSQIATTIAEFQPDVVHFVCHGGVNLQDGRVFLHFPAGDEGVDRDQYSHQLIAHLKAGAKPPAIVVLSACMTASTSDRIHLAAGHEAAPLAAKLVESGIPIVVGMAGHVADIASRLFARRFAEAVVLGEPLVAATAAARRDAFLNGLDAMSSADWSFPAVFLSSSVDAEYAPVPDVEHLTRWTQVEDWIPGLRTDGRPRARVLRAG